MSVAETGAVVKIDGQTRGTTPVKGRSRRPASSPTASKSLGLAAAAAAGAMYFWVAGDDPRKYEGFKEAAPEVPAKTAQLLVGPGAVVLAGRF